MQEMTRHQTDRAVRTRRRRELVAFVVLALCVAGTAVAAKRLGGLPALAAVDRVPASGVSDAEPIETVAEARPVGILAASIEPDPARFADGPSDATPASSPAAPDNTGAVPSPARAPGADADAGPRRWVGDDGAEYYRPSPGYERYFRGRPLRPVRTVWMVVTAYSPDHRSCGKWADGWTASMKSVWTNAMESVAADTRLLPFGSLVSVPGYAEGRVVPVLDRGGAIKGARLDVLYPTHAIARRWGVQRLPVTVWEYAD